MKKRIITSIISLTVLCILIITICNINVNSYIEQTYTKEELTNLILENQSIKDHSHNMAQSARALGWEEEGKLIKQLQLKWSIADELQKTHQFQLDELLRKEKLAKQEKLRQIEETKWIRKSSEYPIATQIWRYMKAQGWNDYVCAGIMGNIMTEAGGQTLNIKPSIMSHDGYYGICQWNKGYGIHGTDLNGQLDFLRNTIKYEFDTYGFKYQNGFNFNSFLNLQDAQAAALAFAKSYERCASASYEVRQSNALKAYNYFIN